MERIEHKQKGFGKRFLSVLLTLAMVLTLLPMTAIEVKAADHEYSATYCVGETNPSGGFLTRDPPRFVKKTDVERER